jgi:hypothetical protein
MPYKSDILRDSTYKGQVETIEQRVFYTLHDGKDLQAHRNSKLLAHLIEHLMEREVITESDLDEWLLKVVV